LPGLLIDRIMPSFLSWGVLLALFASLCAGQAPDSAWQQQVRRYVDKQDWDSAMKVVEEQISRSPQDNDIRSWRARILSWSGRLDQAEHEYLQILAIVPNDPDDWAGLGSVYMREGRPQDALHAFDRAVALDRKRADLYVARARVLRMLDNRDAAAADFKSALALKPGNSEARNGIASLKSTPKQQLIFGTDNDLFSYAGAEQQGSINLISRWASRWETAIGGSFYRWQGIDAEKINLAVTGKSTRWGALTIGGASAHDGGIIPRNEAFFAHDRGWKLAHAGLLRGVETNFEQHWYWYSAARVLTFNGTGTAYFPRDWMWSLRLTGARSQFPGAAAEWRPAGMSKLSFPLKTFESRRLAGNVFYATGTEDYAQINQIGHFSSHTYGGGLHFQMQAAQDISSFAGYETRTQGLNQITFGLAYAIRF
jgi:Flp pilus assembly protein TadD